MLLNNKSRRARRECVLIATQERSSAGLRNASRDFRPSRLATADIPDAEHITFAIRNSDHAVR